jgi:hypothetical protein
MPILLEVGESEEGAQLGDFSGEGRRPGMDIQAFASILFEIMFGCPPQSEASIPPGIPDFVSTIYRIRTLCYVRNTLFIHDYFGDSEIE